MLYSRLPVHDRDIRRRPLADRAESKAPSRRLGNAPRASVPWAIVASVALLALAHGPAFALSTPAAGRDLTRNDRMALTVHRAGAIVVGRMVSAHDTTIRNGPRGATFQKARFAPTRRLKGPALEREFSFCWLPAGQRPTGPGSRAGTRTPEIRWQRKPFLLFLQKPADRQAPADTYGGALRRSCAWYGIEAENSLGGFYLDDRPVWSPALEKEVRAAIARQDIDALIRRSASIALGRVLPPSTKRASTPAARNAGLRTIAVTRMLKGPPRKRLDVLPVVPFFDHRGGGAPEGTREFLWLLRRGPTGALEPVELLAGIVEVRDGRVPAWGMSLEAALGRIEGANPATSK